MTLKTSFFILSDIKNVKTFCFLLELRQFRDFAPIPVKKDVLPQYRKLQWSQNYSGGKKHLVYCSSYCEIIIFDQHGRLIKQLQEVPMYYLF